MVPCRLSRKQGWLLPCIIFQMIGLGFFIASLATTSWIHFACSGHEFEMGIYRICSREMNGSNSEPWNCSAVLLGTNRFTLPHWLFSTQVLTFISLIFVGLTCLISSLYVCAKHEGNVPMGIAGLCMSSGAFMILNLMNASGHVHPTHDTSFISDITQETDNIECTDMNLETSYSLLLLGISTCCIMMAGVWALLGSLFISSGIGAITSHTGYRKVPLDMILYDFDNIGFSSDSDDSSYTDRVSMSSKGSRQSNGKNGARKKISRTSSKHSNC